MLQREDRKTCILDKKLPCHFRIYNETDTVQYPALKNYFQRQTSRNILPEEGARNRNEESSFMESWV